MPEEFASKASVKKLYDRLDTMQESIHKMEITRAEEHAFYESFKQLPDLFYQLRETLASVSSKLATLEDKVDDTNGKIDSVEGRLAGKISSVRADVEEVEDRGKVDILEWLKSKWFEIVIAVVTAVTLINQYIK